MPLRWEILHAEKLVHIVAEGAVTREELEEWLAQNSPVSSGIRKDMER